MTNIFKRPEKVALRAELFQAAVEALRKEGWTVERIAREGKASVRRITKGQLKRRSRSARLRTLGSRFPATGQMMDGQRLEAWTMWWRPR
jgi:hypothetical protein